MYDEALKQCLIKLVYNLRENKNNNRKEVTLFLGAGCSLSSSKKDITTYGIIRDIVKNHSLPNEGIPDNWSDLYQRFVDYAWNGQGKRDRIHLLETYFKDMKPSKGYHLVRFLVENNYINNIITTNFDLMLDEVFKGLSYNLQVGKKKQVIGERPQFTLLKAHGDLRYGQLRFAPSELYRLPDEISSEINKLTNGIVIIAGYRAQDMGIIQALNDSDEHCSYWITYDEPKYYSDYETGAIYSWMTKRNSVYNLLYGNEYGDFDTILEKIVTLLEDKKKDEKNSFYALWENSYIKDYISLNVHIQKIFKVMLKILEDSLSNYRWEIHRFYYAESHSQLMKSLIQQLDLKVIPFEILDCIKNEIDSLLFAISIEIWCLCQGYPITNINLINTLREKYEENPSNPKINNGFWEIVSWLSGMTMEIISEYSKSYCEVSISLDEKRDFQIVLRKVSLHEFLTLFLLIQRIMLFTKTSGEGNDITGISQKHTLENHLYQVLAHEKKVDIHLNTMSNVLFQEIYKNILRHFFSEQITDDRHILFYNNMLYVQVDVETEHKETTLNFFDMLYLYSKKLLGEFIDLSDKNYLIKNESAKILQLFLSSESSGLFMLGESGIGKTCMLKKLIFDLDNSQYIILPIQSKQFIWNNNLAENLFGEKFNLQESLPYISMMLFQRQQKLLIIIDAINELNMPLQQIISIYKELLDLCEFISKENLKNIRMLITCRTDFYYQIKHNTSLVPSRSSFFTYVDESGNESTLYTVSGFKKQDIEKVIYNYNLDESLSVEKLLDKFGDIIYIPFYLDMICRINTGKIIEDSMPNEYVLYQIWFENIFESAKLECISTDCINQILFYIIYAKYFKETDSILTTSELFVGISNENAHASETFEWLTEHSILKKASQNYNYVFFEHDKIEEFILTQYIRKNFKVNLNDALSQIVDAQQNSIIVQESTYVLLQILYKKEEKNFIKYLVTIINDNNSKLIFSFIFFLLDNPNFFYNNLYDFLKKMESLICKAAFENFICLFYNAINDRLDNYQFFENEVIENMDRFINNSSIGNAALIQALNYYSCARYIWIFPIKHDDRSYNFAIQQCKNFYKLNSNDLPTALKDKNNYLLAILLRNSGELNQAVELMKTVYQNLYKNACFNEACQALLELGAMYRELTEYDKALNLYNNYDVNLLSDDLLIYRLKMNTGIIYKNKTQNDLFNKNITEETIKNYHISKELFDKVYIYAKKVNHIPLQLEIIAELIECTVAGYYLSLTTISDAVAFAGEMDLILPKYPVPVRRIQSFRMWARILTIQGNFLEAINRLQEGYAIAVHYNIPFRAADCCNQISGILCENINKPFITKKLLEDGINACQFSINYYQKLNHKEHRYLNDSYLKLEQLQTALKNTI